MYFDHIFDFHRNSNGEYEYKAVYDINHRDVSGQTALYVACLLGNRPIVDILLRHTVKATKVPSQVILQFLISYSLILKNKMILCFLIVI